MRKGTDLHDDTADFGDDLSGQDNLSWCIPSTCKAALPTMRTIFTFVGGGEKRQELDVNYLWHPVFEATFIYIFVCGCLAVPTEHGIILLAAGIKYIL